nr:MAG TPA: hypothetical protein [Caudoviricetes sp.]DAS91445.1 MAG TPA: hypothetical protein [Caudoviricetes sp.]
MFCCSRFKFWSKFKFKSFIFRFLLKRVYICAIARSLKSKKKINF